jgi:TolB-like protein
MIRFTLTLLWSSLLLVGLANCSKEVKDANLVPASYNAADALLKNAKEIELHPNNPILVASLVDIDNVQISSTLGRMIAEQIGSRLAQRGYKIVEVKLRSSSIFVKGTESPNEGEFLLSRELQDISLQHDAQAVIVGTYAKGPEIVFVTVKLVRTRDSTILGSYDYSLPVGKNTKKMLQGTQK